MSSVKALVRYCQDHVTAGKVTLKKDKVSTKTEPTYSQPHPECPAILHKVYGSLHHRGGPATTGTNRWAAGSVVSNVSSLCKRHGQTSCARHSLNVPYRASGRM